MKKDTSIRNICIAAIKRHTITPIDYLLTRIFETETMDAVLLPVSAVHHEELPITQVFADSEHWTLVTTRRIISHISDYTQEMFAIDIHAWDHPMDIKGFRSGPVISGTVEDKEGNFMQVYIETGKASMIMIYAINTLIGQLR